MLLVVPRIPPDSVHPMQPCAELALPRADNRQNYARTANWQLLPQDWPITGDFLFHSRFVLRLGVICSFQPAKVCYSRHELRTTFVHFERHEDMQQLASRVC